MSTLKVNTIQHSNGTDAITIDSTGNAAFSGAVTGTPLGNRNLIINGDMRIAQRGTVAVTSGGGETYTLDRYALLNYWGSGQVTVASSSDAPTGHSKSIGLTVDTSAPLSGAVGYYCTLFQCIEGYNAQYAYNQNITISFWVKSSIAGTYSITLTNDKNAAPTSTTRIYVAEYTVNTANTWEQKTITVDLSSGTASGTWNTTNGTGLSVAFNLGGESNRKGDTYLDTWGTIGSTYDMQSANQVNWLSTTGATFNVSQLQLEVGEVATEFEHRPYDMELQRCQRYYETGKVVKRICVGNGESDHDIQFRLLKRAAPTVTLSNQNGVTNNTPQSNQVDVFGVNGSGNAYSNYSYDWKAEAEL